MDWLAPASPLYYLVLFVGVLMATMGTTFLVLSALGERSVLDHPNERSSHTVPTPRGGGLAVMAVLTVTWLGIGLGRTGITADVVVICAAAGALAVLSWFDDLRGLPVRWRLLAQAVAVAAALFTIAGNGPYFAGLLPAPLDTLVAGILWVWFINLFNFMDGIDGIAGTEAASIAIGVAVAASIAGLGGSLGDFAVVMTAAAIGFLWWNWQPARVFLGDVGSIPIGFMLGWLLLRLSAEGYWAVALILPLYYLADTAITLMRRVLGRQRVWQAHREHFYQRAVRRGIEHAAVVRAVMLANACLVALAAAAAGGWTWPALAGAVVVVAVLLRHLASAPAPGR